MKRRRDNEFITGKVFGRSGKVHRNIPIVKRRIEKQNVLAKVEIFVRLHRLLQHVVIVVTVKNAGLGLNVTVFDRGSEQLHFVTELGDLFIDTTIGPSRMRKDSTVEFFGAEPRLTPAEEKHGSSLTLYQLICEHP